jgi:hypothetical protein
MPWPHLPESKGPRVEVYQNFSAQSEGEIRYEQKKPQDSRWNPAALSLRIIFA